MRQALQGLHASVARLHEAGLLDTRSVRQASLEFQALCEGLAALEIRCMIPGEERTWREALSALINGFATTPSRPARARRQTRTSDP